MGPGQAPEAEAPRRLGEEVTTSRERLINIFMSVFFFRLYKDRLQVKELSLERL